MKRPDHGKLLGGYAPGNLTDAERRALFEAALQDQQLFDALAAEEALRELLEDPAARRRIAEAAAEGKPRFGWLPAAVLAATAVLAFFMLRVTVPHPEAPRMEVAKNHPPAATRAFIPPAETKAKAEQPIAPPPALAPQATAIKSLEPVRVAAAPPPPPPTAKAAAEVVEVAAGAMRVQVDSAALQSRVAGNLANLPAGSSVQGFLPAPLAGAADTAGTLLCTLEQKTPAGEFAATDASKPLDAQAPVRLKIQPATAGYLYVFASRGVLFTNKVDAMKEYFVDVPLREPSVSLVLSAQPDPGPMNTLLERSKAKGVRAAAGQAATSVAAPQRSAAPAAPVILELKLTYR
jgi:hypothetical protein